MRVIHARNVHHALPLGVDLIKTHGQRRANRNSDKLGDVLQVDGPVTTEYARPTERVCFWAERDCNPFFHLMEALWMLGGRNDVAWPTKFVANFGQFSDDGKTFHGAYGHRWRIHFGGDQLVSIIQMLRGDPDTRRAYLGMWDPAHDCGNPGKDLPCNVGLHFMVALDGRLDMTVFNRSNDAIWGAYGANAVHMSVLQEFVAAAIGREVGRYWQVSDNFHAYLSTFEKVESLADEVHLPGMRPNSPYASGEVEPYPLVSTDWIQWLDDLGMFLDQPGQIGLRDPFFRRVAAPMYQAHLAWKQPLKSPAERLEMSLEIARNIAASDWRRAVTEWLARRHAALLRAQDDGVRHE